MTWAQYTLEELLILNYGKSLPENKRSSGEVPVYGSGGIAGFHKEHLVSGPGIIVGRKGSVGAVFFEKNDFFPIDTVYFVTHNHNETDLRFLYYMLKCLPLESLNSDAAVPGLNRNHAYSLKVRIPNYNVQREIASILSAYDDLIENNNRRIQLLEESARLLYQEWFVRLRFPGHEHTRIVNGVPEGWEKMTLKKLGTITTGKTPSTARREYFGGNIPFIKTPDMHGNVYVINTEDALSDEGAGTQQNKFLEKNAIIVSCIGAKAGVVSLTSNKSQTNQQINALSVHEETQTFYLYSFLKDYKEQLLAIGSSGSTMPNVSKGKFENIEVVVPSERLLSIYHDVVSCSFEQILNLSLSNQKLKAARDLLLPRLMSGEIVV